MGYTVYAEIYGQKKKFNVDADNFSKAKDVVTEKIAKAIIFHKIIKEEALDPEVEELRKIFHMT
jgi:hypothetical protein